jgi:hypothetical protein
MLFQLIVAAQQLIHSNMVVGQKGLHQIGGGWSLDVLFLYEGRCNQDIVLTVASATVKMAKSATLK